MEGTEVIDIVFYGHQSVIKSMCISCLDNGEYGSNKTNYGLPFNKDVMVNQVNYTTRIWDANDAWIFLKDHISHKISHVFVGIFDIDNPSTLEEAFALLLHQVGFREVPVLLVGNRADLRKVKEDHCFPLELGPFLALRCGAVKYMECSSKTNFNVQEVLEEAVLCHLSKSSIEFIDKHLYALTNMTSDISGDWLELCNLYLKPIFVLHFTTFHRQRDVYLMDPEERIFQISSKIKTHSLKELFIYRVLEFDRLVISHSLFGNNFNTCKSSPPTCTVWCVHECSEDPTQIVQCRLFSVAESHENVVCSKCPANLRFFANDCKSVASFLVSTGDPMKVRSLIIVNCSGILDFSFLAKLTDLENLIIVNTEVVLASLTFPPHLHQTMKHLVLNNCGITQATDVPSEIGNLLNLQILNIVHNNFKRISTTLGSLEQLHTLLIDHENLYFPPHEVLQRSTRDVIDYLLAMNEHPVTNNKESKLIVVGQEGVGKSTLVKAVRRIRWFTKNEPPPKTDGVDISVVPLKDIQCKVYDMAGDVEYLNTHSLFLSSDTLHLIVFDLSHVIVDKGAQSTDHLCRLELWLETIASQDPKSNVILVGTHADHPLMNKEIITKNRNLLADILIKYYTSHRSLYQTDPCEECFICNSEKCPENLQCFGRLMTDTSIGEHSNITSGRIPHVHGYFEVSSIKKYPSSILKFHNINIERLKSLTSSSISNIMKMSGTDKIPERWLLFRERITEDLSSDADLKQQPLMPLSVIHDIALKLEIHRKERVVAMLRFFHSQGTYLWYEDLPEMKDFIILDPQWLSDQLRTLISHRPSVSSICDGVLHLSELSTVWAQMSEENRRNLLALFRSVGLCFSVSDEEELFPCNLPVGWPDRDTWPPLPNPGENQTSFCFEFSFVPPSFFPDLITEVSKKKKTFAENGEPLYYRFHIVYIRKDHGQTTSLDDQYLHAAADDDDACLTTRNSPVLHTVHYELMPHNNWLTVAIRGPDPPSIIPDIRSTIETVKRRRYSGITYSERMLCPECVMRRVQPAASFRYDIPHDGVCSRRHIVGSNESIFNGKYNSADIVPSEIAQTNRVVGETLEDHFCPKLFVVLPINLEGLSIKDRFVYSYFRDGYAVHLLCECPDQWHFVDSPGFRVGKPKEFFEKYGNRVCKVLRFISALSTPMKAAAPLEPHCKIGAAVGAGAKSVRDSLQSLLDDYQKKYPHLKPSHGSSKDDFEDLKLSSGLQRSELSRFLEVEAKGRNFGPLVCTYVENSKEWLWLCEEHNKHYEIVQRQIKKD